MPEPFAGVTSIDYPIVDADAHVYEPPDVWQARVPQALRARAPRLKAGADGDVWLFDDGTRIRPIGLMAAAGTSYLGFRPSGLTSSRTIARRSITTNPSSVLKQCV